MTVDVSSRSQLSSVSRIVVKVGSRSLVQGLEEDDEPFIVLADQISKLIDSGKLVVVVSSGAVSMACRLLQLERRPTALEDLQGLAAIGQPELMAAYRRAFARNKRRVGQVLLTHADFSSSSRCGAVAAAIESLFRHRCVPVINENDAISTEELGFSDNDQLASMVAPFLKAELLILLTDVDGILDSTRCRVSTIQSEQEVESYLWKHDGTESRGGMISKVSAASRAASGGVPTVIARADDPSILDRILRGDDVGTLLLPRSSKIEQRKHWIGYTLKVRGVLVIDEQSRQLLRATSGGLLHTGVLAVRGSFHAGEAISILCRDGDEVARGLTRYSSRELERVLTELRAEYPPTNTRACGDLIVHDEDLVIL
jgi:glutamate 5-kinase